MIQITRGKSAYVYKINEFNERQILVRLNKHNSRWKHYGSWNTPAQARIALFRLETPDDEREGADAVRE